MPHDPPFRTGRLPADPDAVAPDGSDVRILLALAGGSVAHFELAPGETSVAVQHRTIEEIWVFVAGTGEMWRRHGDHEAVVAVDAGLCIDIPVGTAFQFRCRSESPVALGAIGVTMPPWPGPGEAVIVTGKWPPSVTPGPT